MLFCQYTPMNKTCEATRPHNLNHFLGFDFSAPPSSVLLMTTCSGREKPTTGWRTSIFIELMQNAIWRVKLVTYTVHACSDVSRCSMLVRSSPPANPPHPLLSFWINQRDAKISKRINDKRASDPCPLEGASPPPSLPELAALS